MIPQAYKQIPESDSLPLSIELEEIFQKHCKKHRKINKMWSFLLLRLVPNYTHSPDFSIYYTNKENKSRRGLCQKMTSNPLIVHNPNEGLSFKSFK